MMVSLVLVMVAGFLNAVMDRLAFTFRSSVFRGLNPMFWDVKVSWTNMWKWPLEPYNSWYYFGIYKPRYMEKFPYSTTWLVWLTDGWHLAKMLMLVCLSMAVGINLNWFDWIVDSFIVLVGFTGVFTYVYDYILKK